MPNSQSTYDLWPMVIYMQINLDVNQQKDLELIFE